jgi:elongation factor P hydroxylase
VRRVDAEGIASLFTACFSVSHRTVMEGGAAEPLYLPARDDQPARVLYTRDHVASALHEAAHWCLAGPGRRRRLDYGYWYESPPRSTGRQEAFFAAELQTQALERIFCTAAGVQFRISADNLDGEVADVAGFDARVRSLAGQLVADGLSGRAQTFVRALSYFRASMPVCSRAAR